MNFEKMTNKLKKDMILNLKRVELNGVMCSHSMDHLINVITSESPSHIDRIDYFKNIYDEPCYGALRDLETTVTFGAVSMEVYPGALDHNRCHMRSECTGITEQQFLLTKYACTSDIYCTQRCINGQDVLPRKIEHKKLQDVSSLITKKLPK